MMNTRFSLMLHRAAVLFFFLIINVLLSSQSLKHPHIWVYSADRQGIINNIDQYDWAKSLFDQLKERVDSDKDLHKANPATFLNTIPAIPGEYSTRTAHTNCLTVASEAAILYYLTQDEDYAQLAADVLAHYNNYLSLNDSVQSPKNTGIFFDDWWLESRALFPKIAVIYDFVYDYVNDPSHTVYDVNTQSRKAFDNNEAQYTVTMLCTKVLKSVTARYCNHSILANNGALFNMMMIDDDTTREQFFQRYYYNIKNERKDAFTWSLGHFTAQDIWDETIGYNEGTHEFVIEAMEILDRFKPDLNVIDNNLRIWDGYAFYEQYFYPNGGVLRYGDTGYDLSMTQGYEWMLQGAKRKGLDDYVTLAEKALKYRQEEMGGTYDPVIITDRLGWFSPLQLLWGNNISDDVVPSIESPRMSQSIDHAGLVLQRNYSTHDVENYGLMYYSGGASYVHTHSTGIDLELYGQGFVMGAESGSGSYGTDEHENYRVRLASHNTVIANGSGLRGTDWDTKMSDVTLVCYEPLSNESPISSKFSFSTQYINDTYNDCYQQRTNSIIRTSSTSGYYFDIYRSKGKATNSYHDYIYHNIGDAVSLTYADNSTVSLTSSTKYANEISSSSVTGWTFFEDVKSSVATDKAVKAIFSLSAKNKKMNMYMPAGVTHEYATALAPYTKGALEGYDKKMTPTITLRKMGEAWDAPFVAVFEPTDANNSTVISVENIVKDDKVVGAIVTSVVGGETIEDYILSLDKAESIALPEHFMTFTGQFAIVRKVKQTETTQTVTLYIGEGESLTYGDFTLTTGDKTKAVKEYYGVPFLNKDAEFTLSTRVLGDGGSIVVNPQKESYKAGDEIVVTAVPNEGYVLDEWLGDASGNELTDTLSFFADRSVMARFRYGEYFNLNVAAENGIVEQSIEGKEHIEQTAITLTATPADRYEFVSWSGAVESTDNPLTIRLDSTMNIVANFRELELYKLNVNIIGNGQVYMSPDQEEYLAGTEVTLFAQANTGDVFQNWSGDVESVFSTIYVDMDSAVTLTANFSGVSSLVQVSSQNVKVFPNPSRGKSILSTDYTRECRYTISNIDGVVIDSGLFRSAQQLCIAQPGYYFLHVTLGDVMETMRVIVAP